MHIYLDTYTIQKWKNSKLPKDEISALTNIFSDQNNKLIIAPNHLWEIGSRSDTKNAIELGQFLDQIPNKMYIKISDDIEQIETTC